jgi:lysophospholipase L1-like esterase
VSADAGRPGSAGRVVTSFAALGDSFTAGRDSVDAERWVDQIADALRRVEPDLAYGNFAVDGATSAEVLEQVPAALALAPDLVSVICGANDVLLTSRPDVAGYERRFDEILTRLREGAPEAAVVTATAPESWHFMDMRPRTKARLIEATRNLNDATRRIAAEHGVLCLPVAGHPALSDPTTFSADGLHPSTRGHRMVAAGAALELQRRLGIEIELEGAVEVEIPAGDDPRRDDPKAGDPQ